MATPADSKTQQHWSTFREAGTLFGLRFLHMVYTYGGRGLLSIMLVPVALYFVLLRPPSRRASLNFLRTHQQFFPEQWDRKPGYIDVVRHFKQFAETVVEKLLAWHIELEADEFDVQNPEVIEDLMNDSRGQLIIGTHMGNLEYCRGFMQRYRKKVINILIYDKHSGNFAQMMQRLNPDSRLNVFQVDEFDVSTMLKLKTKIDQGEWVFIAGDRIPLTGLERTVQVEFMGRPAPLPIGAYMLAKALACPVKLMFAYRYADAANRDKVRFEVVPFTEKLTLDRRNRDAELQRYAQQFATEFEKQCAMVPYQWFNFYEFWSEPLDNEQEQ